MISFFRFPSLFSTLGPVKDFLIDATSSLFSGQNLTDFNFSIPQKILGGSIKINVKQVQIMRLHYNFKTSSGFSLKHFECSAILPHTKMSYYLDLALLKTMSTRSSRLSLTQSLYGLTSKF
jgi:hypothetical protein